MTEDKKKAAETPKKQAAKPKQTDMDIEEKIDEAVEESFPASDPPSTSDPSRDR